MTDLIWWGIGGLVVGWLLRALLAARSVAAAMRAARNQAEGLEADVIRRTRALEASNAERTGLAEDLASAARAGEVLRVEAEAQRRTLEEVRGERDRATARATQAAIAERGLADRVAELESMVAELEELRREVRLLTDQRTGLIARLEALTLQGNRIEEERTRAVLLAATVERQLVQFSAATTASRSLHATELLDLKRHLAAAIQAAEEHRNWQVALEFERDELTHRHARLEAERRAAALSHQEALATLQAEVGAVQALADRAEPLRRQLEDREALIRSVAHERDEATRALVQRERAWLDQVAELEREVAQLKAGQGEALGRLQRAASIEAHLTAANRERDDLAAELGQARIEIASLTAEMKDRDLRFRTLLDDRRQLAEASQDQIAHLREGLAQSRTGDDLKQISGIGPHLEGRLKQHGITTFRQIAEWSDSDIDQIAKELGPFAHRIRRDRWVEQAQRQCEPEGQPAA